MTAFTNMHLLARGQSSNHTVDALQVLCGYPLSEPYQVMPRLILYILVWWAFWSRTALVVVMIWTSVAAVHVIALAGSHSYAVWDLDMIPACSQALLGLLFAPAYVAFSRGLKKAWRVDMLAACVWMVLLWTAAATYASTTKFQPQALPCLDSQGHNISSRALLSQCTFQCGNVTTAHAMRLGQSAALVTKPSSYFTGRGKTDHDIVFWTVLMLFLVLLAFWMASKKSMLEYTREQVAKAKTKKQREEAGKMLLGPPKVALVSYIIVVWFTEDALKHMPPFHEQRSDISQWGPLVAFAFAVVGTLIRWVAGRKGSDDHDSGGVSKKDGQKEVKKAPQAAAAAAVPSAEPQGVEVRSTAPPDVEMGMTRPPPYALQEPAAAHVPEGR